MTWRRCRSYPMIVVAAGCMATRSPRQYRDDTHTLLETRGTKLEACYEQALVGDPGVAGRVTIHFVVQRRTGNVVNVLVDADGSTAPEGLVLCVLQAVDGLRLVPPDSREGRATFVYEFKRLDDPA